MMIECPVGKVMCEHYHLGDCNANMGERGTIGIELMEQCPWPSKIKKVESRFDKTLTRIEQCWQISLSERPRFKKILFEAMEMSGFKDEGEG